MQIWVDADACPGEIKELLYRAAERMKIKLTLVATQSLRIPRSYIDTVLVRDGANARIDKLSNSLRRVIWSLQPIFR